MSETENRPKTTYINFDEYSSAENKDDFIKVKIEEYLKNADITAITALGVERTKIDKFLEKSTLDAEEQERVKKFQEWEIANPVPSTEEELLAKIKNICIKKKGKDFVEILKFVEDIENWEEPPKNPFAKKGKGGGAKRGKMMKNSEGQKAKWAYEEKDKCSAVNKKKGEWVRCIWKCKDGKLCNRHKKMVKEGKGFETTDTKEFIEDPRLSEE